LRRGRYRRSIPVKLDEIILKALEKDPDLRYQSAADIRGDLKRLKRDASSAKVVADAASSESIAAAAVPMGSSGGVAVQSAPASSSSVLIAEARRHKGVFIGLALVGLILIAAAGFGIFKLLNRSALALDTRNLSIRQLTDHGQVVPGTAPFRPTENGSRMGGASVNEACV